MTKPTSPAVPHPLGEGVAPQALSALGARVAKFVDSEVVESLAVLATFDPEDQLSLDQRQAVEAISDQLAERDGRPEWMLKESIRVEAMARMLLRGDRNELARVRRLSAGLTSALQGVLDNVLLGDEVDLETFSEDELIAALHVSRWCAAAGSLGRAPSLGSHLDRERIQGRLALIETLRPLREITADGCVGREVELGRLRDHLEGPPDLNIFNHPPLLVYGVGGVGKSTLIAQFLLDLAERPDPVAWAYLDLDRPTLSSYEPLALLTDMIRQVGAQFPEHRRYLDYGNVTAEEASLGQGLESADSESWVGLAEQLAMIVERVCAGRLVVVLDTFEELQREELRGKRYAVVDNVFRMLAMLADRTRMFRLVVSGRAPAVTFLTGDAAGQHLHVQAFQGAAATAVLQHLFERELAHLTNEEPASNHLDPAIAVEVVATVGGAPLTLKLAARVLALEGAAGLQDATVRARAIGRVTDEFVKGFLYHRVLGHIKGDRREDLEGLRAVARAALVLREVDADLLREVVLPAIGRADLEAGSLLRGLMTETAFADSLAGRVRLRDELRGPALLALQYVEPQLVADVHRRAAAYYQSRAASPATSVELAYHRLAAGDAMSDIALDRTTVEALERSAADLPPASREIVGSALAGPGVLRNEQQRQSRERKAETRARRALEAGNLEAAAHELQEQEGWSTTTRLHRLVFQLEEARGDAAAAIAAGRRDLEASLEARDPQRYCTAAIGLALMIERSISPMGGVVVLAEADGQPWLTGHVLLRLELKLNRLAILDRSPTTYDRWPLELDVRALLQKADPSRLRSTTVLVRLLAATLGRDEPALVLDAVRSVGLGTTTYSSHLRGLAEALADWDMDRADPGAVARSAGLQPLDKATLASLTDMWFQAVAGQSLDTVPLLDRAFSVEAPSGKVLQALRMIYLWWGIDPQRHVGQGAEPSPTHFLDGPLDLGDQSAQQLLRALTNAYPQPTDRQVLAAQVGLDVQVVNTKGTRGLSTRALLDQAADAGMLPDLIQQVLLDSKTESFHDELRTVVGPEWLDAHDINT